MLRPEPFNDVCLEYWLVQTTDRCNYLIYDNNLAFCLEMFDNLSGGAVRLFVSGVASKSVNS